MFPNYYSFKDMFGSSDDKGKDCDKDNQICKYNLLVTNSEKLFLLL